MSASAPGKRLLRSVLLFVLLLSGATQVAAQPDEETAGDEKIDYLALSALLIKGGDYDKAEEALAKVDEADDRLDRKRYYTLRGIVSLNKSLYAKSIEAFDAAMAAGQDNPMIHVYLAQAYLGLESYQQALSQLDQAGELEKTMPGIWLLRSQTLWLDGKKQAAFRTLLDAEARFPGESNFKRTRMFYAIELGLFQYAVALGMEYVDQYEVSANDYVALADALRHSGQPKQALKFAEMAHVLYPEEKNVYLATAQAYIDLGQLQAAASVLEEGGVRYNILLKDAAELYKKAGMLERALFVNAAILRQKEKFRQRLALLLANGDYDQVLAMQDDLYRVRLLDLEEFRYALAYSHFKLGEYDRAEHLLEQINDARLFRKATELRKAMASCADEKWLC